jgi:hypothetical protein
MARNVLLDEDRLSKGIEDDKELRETVLRVTGSQDAADEAYFQRKKQREESKAGFKW